MKHMHSRSMAHGELTSDTVQCDFTIPHRPVVKVGVRRLWLHRPLDGNYDRMNKVARLVMPW